MKKIALALILVLLTSAGIAQACGDSVYELQTDPARVGTLAVPCELIVTAVRSSGFYGQQVADPAVNPAGDYSGIWIYTGTDTYDNGEVVAVGDVASVCGELKEYYDLTEIDVPAAAVYGYTLKTGSGASIAPYYITAADLVADGEPWESVQITITDGMTVPVGFDLGFGEWNVDALDATPLIFDDYWYDFATVMEGHCYDDATGIYNYSYSAFKLEPFADGITIVDCAVGVETVSMSTIKAMFR